ncbi:MAG: nitroreductase family protein [Candidatus Bathyarchaeia archaeon]
MEKSPVYKTIKNRRTIRKFLQKPVPKTVLLKCADAARLSPCGCNLQPLRYILVDDPKVLPKVFETLSWAVYLPEYFPTKDEMPQAYLVILLDKNARTPIHDAAIASMSISLVASEEGLGSCILATVDRQKLAPVLSVPEDLKIELIVALGYAAEAPVTEPLADGEIKYWLAPDGVLHVPKRDLTCIVSWNRYQNQ